MYQAERHEPVTVTFAEHGIHVQESRHAATFHMDQALWPFAVMLYVSAGEGELVTPERTYALRRDVWAVVPPHHPYQVVDAAGMPLGLYVVCLQQAVFGPLCPPLEAVVCRLPPAPQRPVWRERMRQLLYAWESRRPSARLRLHSHTLGLLAEVLDGGMEEPAQPAGAAAALARVRHYAERLHHHAHEEGGIDEAAAALGLSRRRFTQLFRAVTGTSWLHALRAARLERACRLLRETDQPIQAIGFACGFNDATTFFRAFRQRHGTTPQAWRDA